VGAMPDSGPLKRDGFAGRHSASAERVIVALDAASTDANLAIVRQLSGQARWFKVGMRQFYADGQPVIRAVREVGAQLFLDLKLHDIPHTVATAIESLASVSPELLTIHASGGSAMIREARATVDRLGLSTQLLAVTVLTSLSDEDLASLGVTGSSAEVAGRWARLAIDAGAHGVVASGHEAAGLRTMLGADPLIVTPGIRLPGDALGDQQRVMTPGEAVLSGASHIVVGRPVIGAVEPATALGAMITDMERSYHGVESRL
jgi:orotidine-5'-phosphate decarboxylase